MKIEVRKKMNQANVPEYMFFTKGIGRHKEKLQAFELALEDAGISQFNLVEVSSIMPPECKIISKQEGLKKIRAGQILHCVLARNDSNEANRLMTAAVGLAVPAEKKQYGYISEHHTFGQTNKEASEYAEDLAASMLAATLGIKTNQDKSFKERKMVHKLSGKIVKSNSICQSAVGKKGLWTCVVASTVLI